MALLARGRAGLEAAAQDVRELGGEALTIELDEEPPGMGRVVTALDIAEWRL